MLSISKLSSNEPDSLWTAATYTAAPENSKDKRLATIKRSKDNRLAAIRRSKDKRLAAIRRSQEEREKTRAARKEAHNALDGRDKGRDKGRTRGARTRG